MNFSTHSFTLMADLCCQNKNAFEYRGSTHQITERAVSYPVVRASLLKLMIRYSYQPAVLYFLLFLYFLEKPAFDPVFSCNLVSDAVFPVFLVVLADFRLFSKEETFFINFWLENEKFSS